MSKAEKSVIRAAIDAEECVSDVIHRLAPIKFLEYSLRLRFRCRLRFGLKVYLLLALVSNATLFK